jgi:AraC-like DNA-binding protein
VIAESMREGDPKITTVTNKPAMSPRTLQRRLNEQEVVFKRLVDDTCRLFAVDYLRDHKHAFTEMAFFLGYSEVSAFNRAFKRWTGRTPSNYRNRLARRNQ